MSSAKLQRVTKEIWDILALTHDGTSTMKFSKLQMLTTKFKSIKMNEDETFFEAILNLMIW